MATKLGLPTFSSLKSYLFPSKMKQAMAILDDCIVAGAGVTVTYDDVAGTATVAVSTEYLQDAIAAVLAAGSGITATYDDAGNLLTLAVSVEFIQDTVAAFIVGGTGITKTYDDTANTLTLTAP